MFREVRQRIMQIKEKTKVWVLILFLACLWIAYKASIKIDPWIFTLMWPPALALVIVVRKGVFFEETREDLIRHGIHPDWFKAAFSFGIWAYPLSAILMAFYAIMRKYGLRLGLAWLLGSVLISCIILMPYFRRKHESNQSSDEN